MKKKEARLNMRVYSPHHTEWGILRIVGLGIQAMIEREDGKRHYVAYSSLATFHYFTCHDCGVREGQLHRFGCDMERCPFCGRQLITCHCCYDLLAIDCSPGTWAYEHGLTEEQSKRWDKMLTEKGRIPYVHPATVCGYCGKVQRHDDFFSVPEEEWGKYVITELQDKVICRECYIRFQAMFPQGWISPPGAERGEKDAKSINRP